MAVVVEYEGSDYAFVIRGNNKYWVNTRNRLVPLDLHKTLEELASASGVPTSKLELPELEPKIEIPVKEKRRKKRNKKGGIFIDIKFKGRNKA